MDKRSGIGSLAGLALCLLALALVSGHAHAQSSLGIGAAEPTISPVGPLAGVMQKVNEYQQAFYRALTEALKAMRHDPAKAWILIGISFAYGIFHAAGPGHGKAVISSYMLANEVALRRGVVLSFLSAMIQAVTAIILITLAFFILRGTALSLTDAEWAVEIVSYAMVAAFGAWLLWRKLSALMPRRRHAAAAASLSAASVLDAHDHAHSRSHETAHVRHAHDHAHGHGHDHHHAPGEVCAECGHSHAPDPALLGAERFDWRAAWSAVTAVGLRPCSGALIVLTFAFLNGLYLAGIASVFAMAAGTAITVSILATLAVTAKNVAVKVAGEGRVSGIVGSAFEIGGALLVLLFGLALLAASLQGVKLPS